MNIMSASLSTRSSSGGLKRRQENTFDNYVDKRDYKGALVLIQYKRIPESALWTGYCYFHAGEYKKAIDTYQSINKTQIDVLVNLSCCYYYLGLFDEAQDCLTKVENSPLKTRLQFHMSHKAGNEKELMKFHEQLQDATYDQLSLASVHYLRSHYQEAIDIYKKILLQNREFSALNVYIAQCYYKLDYYDVSQEILNVYLHQYPDSITTINLKACNQFKLYNGKAAEGEIKSLLDQNSSNLSFGIDLIKHNIVVFRGGEGALQILPSLIGVIPEARLNLVIYFLKQDEIQEAFDLLRNLEPAVPQEYILKGIVNAALGQEAGYQEYLKIAQQYFQLVGSSVSECDTLPGRQCMASYHFLLKQFDQVYLYLSSIKSYFFNNDSFNFNLAQAHVALGSFPEAEETLLLVQSDKLKSDYCFISHLCRCYIMNKKPQKSWELYLKLDTSSESFQLLQLIANDCYKMGEFYYAAKAFDMLERLDPLPEFWEGKRGACSGLFQLIVAKKRPREELSEIISLLRNSANTQVEQVIRTVKRWAKEHRIPI